MKKANIIASLLLLAFASFFVIEGGKMPMADGLSPGAGFVPFWVGAFTWFLSLLLLIQSVRSKTLPEKKFFSEKSQGLKDIVYISSSLFAYCGFILLVGYSMATFLFLFFLFKVVGKYGLRASFGLSAGTAAALYGIFEAWLDMAFPAGVVNLF
jgi:hypothetical protein